MMSRILFGVFSFALIHCHAQTIKVSINKESFQIGETIELVFEVQTKNKKQFELLNTSALFGLRKSQSSKFPDTIAFDVFFQSDTLETIQNQEYWLSKLVIQTFDTGYIVLPPFAILTINDTIFSNPILIHSSLTQKIKEIDLYDIREDFTPLPLVPFNFANWFYKYGVWILVFLVLSVIVFLYLRKKKKTALIEAELSAEEMAFSQIDQLQRKRIWENDKKQHFVELSLILRRYLSSKLPHQFLEKTSQEVELILKKSEFGYSLNQKINQVLNVSDLVKFANSSVDGERIEKMGQQLKNTIKDISNLVR
jgi:hypothetical protein